MEYDEISFSAIKRRRIKLNVLGSLVGLLAVVVLLNLLGSRHFFRWHLDSRDTSMLSPMTVEALKSLKQDVRVVVLFKTDLPLYASINNLLKEYENVTSRLKVERIDYIENPQAAEAIKNKYRHSLPATDKETFFRDLVIFEVDGKPPRVIYEKEFSDFNVSDVVSGRDQKIKRITFKGEMLFTGALASLMESGERVAYFSMGHNEFDPEEKDELSGYSKFAEILTQNYVQVKKFHIWAEETVPADCNLLVIPGPRKPLVEQEVAKVGEYLKRGGSLLVLFPQSGVTRLEPLLKEWGVEVKDQLVYDPEVVRLNQGLMLTNFNSQSAITRPLYGSQMYMPLTRAVCKTGFAGKAADAPQVMELLLSGPKGVLVAPATDGKEMQIESEESQEFSMAVSVEKGALQGVDSLKGTTRIVAVGSSVFLNNNWIDASFGNRDFAVLAINWLLDRSQLMKGVGPRAIVEYQLNLSDVQIKLLMWVMMAIVPGIVLGVGLIVWARRRN